MKKQNAKKLKGQGPLLKSLVNRNIGSRTGRDVKAGKKITKDKDGYENFDDYWSESDADLTSNTTFHSVSSRLSANQEKENVSSLITSSQPVGSKVSTLTSNFSSASCSQPVGAAACYLGYLTVGSRTGQNVIAGKNIRKHDDGFDNFDTYWSESEPDSMLSFHKSVHINESKSFISAGVPREEEEEEENDKSEVGGDSDSEVIINTRRSAGTRDTVNISQTRSAASELSPSHSHLSDPEDESSVSEVGGDSDSEVIINTRRSAGKRDTVNISQTRSAASELSPSHSHLSDPEDESSVSEVGGDSDSEVIINTRRSAGKRDTVNISQTRSAASELSPSHSHLSDPEDESSVSNVSNTGVEDPDSVCETIDEEDGLSLATEEDQRETGVGEADDRAETEDAVETEKVSEIRQQSPRSQDETATSQSVCSEERSVGEEVTGTVVRRPGSISVFKHHHQEEETLQECSAEGVTETIHKVKSEANNSMNISNSRLDESKGTRRRQRKSKASENATDNESVEIPTRRTRSRSRGSAGNVSFQSKGHNVKDTSIHSERQSLPNTSLMKSRQSDTSVHDNSSAVIDKSIQKQGLGKKSGRKSKNRSVLEKDGDLDLTSARELNASLNKSKGGKRGQSGRKTAQSRKSTNSDTEDVSECFAVKSGKKQTNVSQRKSSEVRESISSPIEDESEASTVGTKSEKKGTKISQRKSSESRKSLNSDVESDIHCKAVEQTSLKRQTKVSQRKSSELRKSFNSNVDVFESSAVEAKCLVENTKSLNSDVEEDLSKSVALETKSLKKQALVRQRKTSVSKSVNSDFEDAETKSIQKQAKSSRKNVRKSSKSIEDEADESSSVAKSPTKVDSDGEEFYEVEDDITDIQKTHGPLKAVKSNRKSLRVNQDQKQQVQNKSIVNKSTAHELLQEDSVKDKSTSSSSPEIGENADVDADEVIEDEISFSKTVLSSSDHGLKERSVEINETVTTHSRVSVKPDNIREITPSDLIMTAPVGNTTARSRLNLGGDVTGSISKNVDVTTKTVSNTPMHSFRTKKRLSYSKFLDDSVEQEKESNTSEEKNTSRPPALESLVEEEEEEEGNCDFLSLRTSHRDTLHKTTDADSIDDNFWKVEDEKPKKGKAAKRASNTVKGKGGNAKKGNDKDGSGKEEGSGEEKEEERKKSVGEKRGRKKGQKKSGDEGSPEKQSRKSEVEAGVQEQTQTKASGKQRKRAKSSGITKTPSSTKLKRSSTDTMNNTRAGGKRSRSARVTKTKEMMEQEKRSPQSPVENLPVARGRLSHLHLAGVGETPRSGVSFRQRRRRSLSDGGKPLLNTSCPVDLAFSPAVADDEAKSPEASRRESTTPYGTLSSVLPLTPCLVPKGTVKSVEKKKRRVTISNIVEKASVSYTDSSVSETGHHGKASPGNSSANISTASYGDITGSPVHFFEVTNTETPDPITAPPKTKIIYPKPGPDGLRRSQRVRVKPVEWYKNEHIIYENRAGDFVIAGIQPSKEAEYLAAEMEKRKRRALSKLKQPKKPRISRQKLLERQNLSMHQDPPAELDYTISSEMPVINPNTNREVLIDCMAPSDDAMYVGADGNSPREEDPYIICHALRQPRFTGGHLLIAPFKEKSRQLLTENTLIFTIIHGKLSVTIHRGSSILEAGDQFFVPRGNSYSIKNLRDEEAKLSFVNLLEGENQITRENHRREEPKE